MLGDEIKKNTVLLVGAKTNYLLISLKDRLSETSLKVNVFSAQQNRLGLSFHYKETDMFFFQRG